MVSDIYSISRTVCRGKAWRQSRSFIVGPECNYRFFTPVVACSISPMFHTSVLSYSRLPLGVAFSSSVGSPRPPTPKISSTSHEFPPPPPVNPRETVNPDPATLREQWSYATRMYSRWYGHAWGTAILAGVSFYALGWLIKGENPVSRTQEEKKEEK